MVSLDLDISLELREVRVHVFLVRSGGLVSRRGSSSGSVGLCGRKAVELLGELAGRERGGRARLGRRAKLADVALVCVGRLVSGARTGAGALYALSSRR